MENDDLCRLMNQFADQGTGTITASRLHAEQSIRIECDKGTFFWRINTDQLVSRTPGEKDYTPVDIPGSYLDKSMVTTFLKNSEKTPKNHQHFMMV